MKIAAILLTMMVLATPASAAPRLPYGANATPDRPYSVLTTTYGCTTWDDNGIGFHGGVDLHRLRWGVAELGWHGGRTGTALGGIPGGTLATVTHGKRSVNVVFADVGHGGHKWQLDLHCGVARALGIRNPTYWTGTVTLRIRNTRIDLNKRQAHPALGTTPTRCVRTMKACKKKP